MNTISFDDFDLNISLSQVKIRIGFFDLFAILEKYHPNKNQFKNLYKIIFDFKKSVDKNRHQSLFHNYLLSLMDDIAIYHNYENELYVIPKLTIEEAFLETELEVICSAINQRFTAFYSSLRDRVSYINKNNCNQDIVLNDNSISLNSAGLSLIIHENLISEIIESFDIYLATVKMDKINKSIEKYLNAPDADDYFNTIIKAGMNISNQKEFEDFISLYAPTFKIIE